MMGQLAEIKTQRVNYNDYAYQYALIQVIDNGNEHIIPCVDCVCRVSFYDNNEIAIVKDKEMTSFGSGLYGYTVTPGEFNLNMQYRMQVDTYSATYGNGSVNSVMQIETSDKSVSALAGDSILPDFSLCDNSLIGNTILCSDWKEILLTGLSTIKEQIKSNLESAHLLGLIRALFNIASYIGSWIVWILAQWLAFVLNPIGYITDTVIPAIMDFGWNIIIAYIAWTLIVETVIIAYSVYASPRDNHNGVDVLATIGTWGKAHIQLIIYTVMAFVYFSKFVFDVLQTIAQIVSSVNPVSK